MALGHNRGLYLTFLVVVPMIAISSIGAQLVKVTARYAACTLPCVMLMVGFVITEVARLIGKLPQASINRGWLLAAVLPALVVGDFIQLDVAYYQDQYGQRGRWREATQFVRDEAAVRGLQGIRTLTTNHPTVLYYLRPWHWVGGDADPHPTKNVEAALSWRLLEGRASNKNSRMLHDPGAANHIAWHLEQAKLNNQLFAVIITLPELEEEDPEGLFLAALKQETELSLFLPAWVGPKDNSIYIYLPKKGL